MCKLGILIWLMLLAGAFLQCGAQTRLSLQEAVARALDSRASLKAEAERISSARGLEKQSGLIPNPTFQFENQNLRPGQDYTRDVDTYAFLTQPLDILGKRRQRIAVAGMGVASAEAQYELARRQVMQSVKQSYWQARGAQETRDLLKANVGNFQSIINYYSAQLSVGAIPEQDFLRIRLEGERLQISYNLAVISATRARVQLQSEMGQTDFPELVLTEPLDADKNPFIPKEAQQVLAQRLEVRVARAALEEAQAKARLETVSARPDLSISYGYKRTQLPDSTTGVNTALAGLQITLPITDRNQGNRAAAVADVSRQQQLLAATQASILADYYSALQEYQLRRSEVIDTLRPLQEHGKQISEIAEAAFEQGGTDVLRLLDAERARLDAQLAFVQGMVEYQQSIVNLEGAEGVAP
ncbi:MAG: TolC family protein [Acidobacteriia bacterium]|nr:TolC family protein [Terriglobia bacterium]